MRDGHPAKGAQEVPPKLPTLPLGDLAEAMRGERRAVPRGEFLGVVFLLAARRSRLFPSFLGVLRMLKAIDWRRSGWEEEEGRRGARDGPGSSGSPSQSPSEPPTCLLGACCSLRRLRWELRRSRGVWGRGKQLTGFLDWEEKQERG